MRADERAEEAVDQREEDEDQPQPPPPAAGSGREEEGMLSGSSAEEDWAGASTAAAAAAAGAGEGSTATGLGAGGAAGGAGVDELVGGREVIDDFWVRSASREGGDGGRRAGGVSCGLGGEIGRWQTSDPRFRSQSESSREHRQSSRPTASRRERERAEKGGPFKNCSASSASSASLACWCGWSKASWGTSSTLKSRSSSSARACWAALWDLDISGT